MPSPRGASGQLAQPGRGPRWGLVAVSALLLALALGGMEPPAAHALKPAVLTMITINGVDIPNYDRDHGEYTVGVAHGVTAITATAAIPAENTLTCGTDTDVNTDGCQVTLGGEGSSTDFVMTVTNAHPDQPRKDYAITVNRGRQGAHQWKASDDIYSLPQLIGAGNTNGRGLGGSDTLLWAVNVDFGNTRSKAYAFDRTTGAEDIRSSFRTDGSAVATQRQGRPRGLAYLGEVILVSNDPEYLDQPHVIGYTANALGSWEPNADWDIGNNIAALDRNLQGIWFDGELLWAAVSDSPGGVDRGQIRAYRMDEGSRGVIVSDRTIDVSAHHTRPQDIWSDGETIWFSTNDEGLLAIDLYSGARVSAKDFTTTHLTAEGSAIAPWGIWSDGETMWVMAGNEHIYSFNMPVSTGALLKPIKVSDRDAPLDSSVRTHAIEVAAEATSLTFTLEPRHFQAVAVITPADADLTEDGHQVDLSGALPELSVVVTAQDGQTTGTYTITIMREPSDDATLSGLTLSGVRLSPAFASGTTAYTASVGYTVTGTTVAATTSDAAAAIEVLDADDSVLGTGASVDVDLVEGENVIKVKVTAGDGTGTETYTVTVTRTEEDLSLTPASSDPVAPFPSTAVYTIQFQGRWTTAVTPGGLPGGAHFSRLIGGVHNANVTFLESGGTASAGVESMAEVGGTAGLRGEVEVAANADPRTALSVLEGASSSIGRTATSTLSDQQLTEKFPLVTLTTMIAPSHDWFVGVSGLSLLDDSGLWRRSHEVDLFPWDAGTEEGNDFALNPSVPTTPQGVITSIRGTGPFTTERIASLSFSLARVRTKRSFAENTAAGADIGPPVAPVTNDGTPTYRLLTGSGFFDVDPSTGQLRTKAGVTYDYETRPAHVVIVRETDTEGELSTTVLVNLTNVDEPGTVTLSMDEPRLGTLMRASLSDPDGSVRSASWTWHRSTDKSTWTAISGASQANYRPVSSDRGQYLRATVSYTDGEGSGKTAQGVSEEVVAAAEEAPDLSIVTLVSGLGIPWGIAFAPDGTMLFTERSGDLSVRLTDGTVRAVTADMADLVARGEGGLMAIVVDPNFSTNRRFYTCQVHTGPEVQVIAWTMNSTYTEATRATDPLVGGLPAAGSGRHSGCRMRFGNDGYLWIGTGDAATGTVPQDSDSLGGKVLRVNASTGAAAPGNPSGSRVYSYGHRNIQGLALRPGSNQMWAVEHGPSTDDEINLITAGGNYGWDPVPGYNESVAMTDLVKFPDAVEAKWSTGAPTLAMSGGVFLEGDRWGDWEGRLAVASLKDQSLRLFEFTDDGAFVGQVVVSDVRNTYGRLRTPMMGPDGALYLTTSRGGTRDRILQIIPNQAPAFADDTAAAEVPENSSVGTVVATVAATDPEGDDITYALGGADAAFFSIPDDTAGAVEISMALDADTQTTYEIVVTATDEYRESDTIAVTVTATDVNEPADVTLTASSGVSATNGDLAVDENHDGPLATFTATDPEGVTTLTYTWSVAGTDRLDFAITTAGALSFVAIPDYERPADSGGDNIYDITVNALDSDGMTGSLDVTVTVEPVNEPPEIAGDTAPSIEEEGATLVGTYTASDPEGATIAWQPLAGDDAAAFEFNSAAGRLSFRTAPDFEDPNRGGDNTYEVTLGVSAGGHTETLPVTVTVTNREEAGTLTLPTTRPQVDAAYTATLSDPDIVGSTDWTWQRSTSPGGPWDQDISGATSSSYTPAAADVGYYLQVTADYTDGFDAGNRLAARSTQAVRTAPVDNNPPVFGETNPSRSVAEDAGARAPVGAPVRATDTDAGDSVRYELMSGTALFTVDPSSGQIRVRSAASLDHETAPTHTVTVRALDNSNASATVDVAIEVTDVNERPVANDTSATTPEDMGTVIPIILEASDPDVGDSLTFAIVARPANGNANVGPNGTLIYDPNADYHGADSFSYTATDDGTPPLTSRVATVSISVTPVNDAPAFPAQPITRRVSESAEPGDDVGLPVTAEDVDGDTLTYSLTGAAEFEIGELSGQIVLADGASIAAGDTYTVTVTATDSGTPILSATTEVTITVTAGPVSTPRPVGGVPGGGGGGGGGPTPSTADFEWTVKHDLEALDSANDAPTGVWSDGVTLWVANNAEGPGDAVYAYGLESGERVEEREFALDAANRAPRGIWSDGTTVWVADSGRDRLFAYDLATGERLAERDIELAAGNGDARGIWSDGTTMWVLDDRAGALFAYDLARGEPLGSFALDSRNGSPRGLWSDSVSIWVSDAGTSPRRLFAYRLPTIGEEGVPEDAALRRVDEEDFAELSNASNNSPRGIWASAGLMYVADASDRKAYTYNMPDAIDARLASLTLEGIAIGEFDPGTTDYEGVPDEGVTVTAVTAEAMQRGATVTIEPPDGDGDDTNGYEVPLEGLDEITVTVTSADESRMRVYRVALESAAEEPWLHCLRGDIVAGFTLLVYEGGTVDSLAACAEDRDVVALYTLHQGAYVSYIPGAPDFVNRGFRELFSDGIPAVTPLVAASNGPSDDPAGPAGGLWPWPECLGGEVVDGFSLVVYEGGTLEDLESCVKSRGVTAVYALAGGEWVSHVLGAPALANQQFRELFAEGLSSMTPLLARRDQPAAASSDQDGEGGN